MSTIADLIKALTDEALKVDATRIARKTKEGNMPDTLTTTDSKPDIQAALDEAGIDYAKSWNRDKLIEALAHALKPGEIVAVDASTSNGDDEISMSFGPTGTSFMTDAGFSPEKSSNNRGWFTFNPDQADSLLERLEGEIANQKSDENGSKATARNLERARDRIVARLS